MSGRGEGGRGSGARGSFNRATKLEAIRSAGTSTKPDDAIKIVRAGDQVRARVAAHGAKHQGTWTQTRFDDAFAKIGPAPALKPDGSVEDSKTKAMTQAKAGVVAKQAQRLSRVQKAETNMLATGKVRENRKVIWGKGLGE